MAITLHHQFLKHFLKGGKKVPFQELHHRERDLDLQQHYEQHREHPKDFFQFHLIHLLMHLSE